jgi:osmotically-inducible protein OsmY
MRSDAELQSDVLNELKRDEWLRIKDLDVKVEGRVVTLSGSAETPCQRWRALQLTRYVAGIAPVSDHIIIQAH